MAKKMKRNEMEMDNEKVVQAMPDADGWMPLIQPRNAFPRIEKGQTVVGTLTGASGSTLSIDGTTYQVGASLVEKLAPRVGVAVRIYRAPHDGKRPTFHVAIKV